MLLRRTTLGLLGLLSLAACEVEKTREGELPDVKIEGGQLPKYEIKGEPKLELRLDTEKVVLPKLDDTATIVVPKLDRDSLRD
jgi:hypothetical protein